MRWYISYHKHNKVKYFPIGIWNSTKCEKPVLSDDVYLCTPAHPSQPTLHGWWSMVLKQGLSVCLHTKSIVRLDCMCVCVFYSINICVFFRFVIYLFMVFLLQLRFSCGNHKNSKIMTKTSDKWDMKNNTVFFSDTIKTKTKW